MFAVLLEQFLPADHVVLFILLSMFSDLEVLMPYMFPTQRNVYCFAEQVILFCLIFHNF